MIALVLAGIAVLAGCAQMPRRSHARPAATLQPLAQLDLPVTTDAGRAAALVIAAEFALQDRDATTAAHDYAEAAQLSRDPDVAKRALDLALATGDAAGAARMIGRWGALGAGSRALAGARGQLALLRGDRAGAEKTFGLMLQSAGAAEWKTFIAGLLGARDTALAGRVLEDLATPARLPADESIWIAASQLAEHLGRHAFARKLAAATVRRFNGAEGIRWAASLQLAAHDQSTALALYAQGVKAHPKNVDLRLGYAALLATGNRIHEALAVLAAGPQTTATWSARVAYAARAKDTTALRQLYASLQRAPAAQRDGNLFLLGQLAESLKHDQQALRWYGEVDPDGEHAFESRVRSAVLLDKSGQHAEAHTVAEQLQQDYVDDPDSLRTAYELDAQMYSQDGEHAKAIAAYDRGLAAMPDDPALIYDRGIEQANAGKIDAALADFRSVLKL
ncbi:MAG TPA: tetratricopeptide repeat protein, partial [Rhodanobacteraceae bacterium]|nr:tetratricopeptide repeat protein [Rhodanobacteraceae bacterium]